MPMAHGSVDHFKGKLVGPGYARRECVDFDETFSPVIKHVIIRAILSIATSLHQLICQLDIKNTS